MDSCDLLTCAFFFFLPPLSALRKKIFSLTFVPDLTGPRLSKGDSREVSDIGAKLFLEQNDDGRSEGG